MRKLQMVYIVFYHWVGEVYKKIEAIVREEMDRASAQEIMMPNFTACRNLERVWPLERIWRRNDAYQ